MQANYVHVIRKSSGLCVLFLYETVKSFLTTSEKKPKVCSYVMCSLVVCSALYGHIVCMGLVTSMGFVLHGEFLQTVVLGVCACARARVYLCMCVCFFFFF